MTLTLGSFDRGACSLTVQMKPVVSHARATQIWLALSELPAQMTESVSVFAELRKVALRPKLALPARLCEVNCRLSSSDGADCKLALDSGRRRRRCDANRYGSDLDWGRGVRVFRREHGFPVPA